MKAGDWVVVTMGNFKGRPGKISETFMGPRGVSPECAYECYVIQFGTDGPFKDYRKAALRLAHKDEIPDGVA